jgi:hypothetical protein
MEQYNPSSERELIAIQEWYIQQSYPLVLMEK